MINRFFKSPSAGFTILHAELITCMSYSVEENRMTRLDPCLQQHSRWVLLRWAKSHSQPKRCLISKHETMKQIQLKHSLQEKFCKSIRSPLYRGSPTPGSWTSIRLCPVRNWAQQEVSSGRVNEASSVFTAAPHRLHYRQSSVSFQHFGELYNYFNYIILYY